MELLIKTWEAKENFVDNHCHSILRLLMFCQILLSKQVKRRAIVSNKDGIYEFPHELSTDFRKILGFRKLETLKKIPKFRRIIA